MARPLFCIATLLIASSSASAHLRRAYEHRKTHLDPKLHDQEFFDFVTRPDLDIPRWNITVFQPEKVTPGYWFITPYEEVQQDSKSPSWSAPSIYDGNGDLVYTAYNITHGWSCFDFRPGEASINGSSRNVLSFLEVRAGGAIILDDKYSKIETVTIDHLNMHEFLITEGGTKALALNAVPRLATPEDSATVAYDGQCHAQFDGLAEYDLSTGNTTFSWSSYGKIALSESYVTQSPVAERCSRGDWDYLHLNSIDTFTNGDFLLSARRTNALYRVSRSTGDIIWRLGGRNSDFDTGVASPSLLFSGQHSARIHSHNDTHTLISILDNAIGPGDPSPTNAYSRGLLLAADTQSMTVSVVREFAHPDLGYADGQGNMQRLEPSGNFWISWRDAASQTEHDGSDGSLILDARLHAGLRNYRSFKMPWVGRPTQPPDVVVRPVADGDGGEITHSVVSVSWNGATEVKAWEVYAGDQDAEEERKLLATVPKNGFETTARIEGAFSELLVVAVDAQGKALEHGEVAVQATMPTAEQPAKLSNSTEPVTAASSQPSSVKTTFRPSSVVAFIIGVIATALTIMSIAIFGFVRIRRRWFSNGASYVPVAGKDELDEEVEIVTLVGDDGQLGKWADRDLSSHR
jgi:hypothetical protein